MKRLSRSMSFIFILLIAVTAMPAFAGVVPSKTAVNQSIAQRDADLALVRDVVAHDQVAAVLAQHGLTLQEGYRILKQTQAAVAAWRPNSEGAEPFSGLTYRACLKSVGRWLWA